MKTQLLILAIALGSVATAQTQTRERTGGKNPEREEARELADQKRTEIERRKVAFISTELELTQGESEKFWPVYNAYKAEKLKFHEAGRAHVKAQAAEKETMSPEEMDKLMKQKFETGRQELALEENYYERFKKVLPTEKVMDLYQAERDFKREIMRNMRDRSGDERGDMEQRRERIEREAPQRERLPENR